MNSKNWILSLCVLLPVAVSALPVPDLVDEVTEKKEIVQPGWETTLWKGSFSPGFATLVGTELIFSQWFGRAGCPAKDLYKFDIAGTERQPKKIFTAACVHDVRSYGGELFVSTSKDADTAPSRFYSSDSVEFKAVDAPKSFDADAFGGGKLGERVVAEVGARFALALDQTGEKPTDAGSLSFLRGAGVLAMFRWLGKTKWIADVWHMPKMRPAGYAAFASDATAEALGAPTEVFVDAGGRSAFVLWKRKEWAKIAVADLVAGPAKALQWIGTEDTLPATWTQVATDKYSVNEAWCPQATRHGLLVYDRTRDANGARAVAYITPRDKKVSRVQLTGESFISGVAFLRGGLLVSRPQAGIVWYGEKARFEASGEIAGVEWKRNPRVPVVENDESGKEGKK